MSRNDWSSAISPQHPPVPRGHHWATGLFVSMIALSAATYIIADRSLPEPSSGETEVESVIVSLGAPAQRLEPPPPPPPDAPPPPEIPPEPQAPTERAEDAPPPEPPEQPRPILQPQPSDGRLSSGFGQGSGPPSPPAPPPPPPPPRVVELDQMFIDISTREYVSRVEYPYRALQRRIEGKGRLQVLIDRNGRVLEWNLIESTGSRILDTEIERVAKSVEQLDPLPEYYNRSTARLIIPFIFMMG